MSYIEVPELIRLRGQDAVEALQELVKEFERQKGRKLTDKQAAALIKIANQLMWSIKAEMHQTGLSGTIKRKHFGFLRRKTSYLNSSTRV